MLPTLSHQHLSLSLSRVFCFKRLPRASAAGKQRKLSAGIRVGSWSQELLGIRFASHVSEVAVSARKAKLPCHAFDVFVRGTACKKERQMWSTYVGRNMSGRVS